MEPDRVKRVALERRARHCQCSAAAIVVALRAVAVTLAAAWPAGAAVPAAPPRYSVEHAVSIRSFTDFVWSPDGRRLAMVVADPDTVESGTNHDLWLADLGRHELTRLTRNPKGDASPTFSTSGDTLAFVSTREKDERQTIYMMSLRGGDPWAFGSYDEAVGEVHWSPDGRWLAYVKNDTLPRTVRELRRKKWDPTVEDERLQYPHLWVVEIATGKQRRLVSGPNHVWNARWSPDSRSIAFLVSPTGAADDGNLVDIGVVPLAGGPMRKLGAIGAGFAWSADSRWIAWSSNTHRDVQIEKDDLWVCGALAGSPVNLTRDFDGMAGPPAWSPGSDTLYFHAARGVTTMLATVSRTGGPVRLVADRDGRAGAIEMASNGRAAWVESHAKAPDEIHVADHPRLAGSPVTRFNAGVSALSLGETRIVRWRSSDSVAVEGLLVRPPGAARGPLKTIVLLHGGPYGSRYDLGFEWLAQFYAGAGYQAFMPNFRSSGGYGMQFLLRERADWGGQDWRDVMSGIDSLSRSGLIDAHRLGVMGESYGGYLAAWAITQTDRFKAAAMDRGIANLPALWGQSDVHRYRAYDFQGRPWETFERQWEQSPIAHIARAKTPMLIVVGDNDARTPIAQSRELYQSLRSLGVPVEFVHYPREGHGLREPRHRADALLRERAWFDRWVR